MQIQVREFEKEFDVIVVGGGPAGCAAAVAAARNGASVLLMEGATALGGMSTLGLVPRWMAFDDREKPLCKGISKEIINRFKALMGFPADQWRRLDIKAEPLKRMYDELMEENGVEVRFQTSVCQVETENGEIRCLLAADKSGLKAYRAHTYIDCTGDGDVANYSGVPMEYGDAEHYVQEASLCFTIADYHKSECTMPISSGPDDGVWPIILKDPKYSYLARHFIPIAISEDVIVANAGGMANVDATDPAQLSAAYIEGRRIAEEMLRALKEYQPAAFRDAQIVQTAPLLGVRESRRIVGEYVLTAADYIARRSFPDEIGRNSYWMDCHLPDGKNNPCEVNGVARRYEPGESHGIPFRCLVPKNVDNLLVAGRCISMDNVVLASVRVMPNCLSTGEAAGTAAAMCAKADLGVHALDPMAVVEQLKKN